MSGIIWLASYPKSGNTWLRAFLANYFRNPARPMPINELPDYAYGDNFLIHYEQVTGKPATAISDDEATRLRPVIHRWFARARGETVFVKTHSIVGVIGDVPLITPDATAGAIYVMRHPFDLAVSWSHHYQTSLDRAVESICRPGNALPRTDKLLIQCLGSWAEHVHSWTTAPGLTRHVLRYEDMLAQPRATFSGLVRFLGVPLERARLKKAIRFSSFDELAGQERKRGFVEARPDGKTRFFREGGAGRGHEILTRAQQERIVTELGEVMRRFGYDDVVETDAADASPPKERCHHYRRPCHQTAGTAQSRSG